MNSEVVIEAGSIGLFLGVMIAFGVFKSTGAFYEDAAQNYQRCLSDGAPRDTCLENYLLPKEGAKP